MKGPLPKAPFVLGASVGRTTQQLPPGVRDITRSDPFVAPKPGCGCAGRCGGSAARPPAHITPVNLNAWVAAELPARIGQTFRPRHFDGLASTKIWRRPRCVESESRDATIIDRRILDAIGGCAAVAESMYPKNPIGIAAFEQREMNFYDKFRECWLEYAAARGLSGSQMFNCIWAYTRAEYRVFANHQECLDLRHDEQFCAGDPRIADPDWPDEIRVWGGIRDILPGVPIPCFEYHCLGWEWTE
ncbi:MAG: hypothetical protein AB7S26_38050 [Sandaracinaceae bacterium]